MADDEVPKILDPRRSPTTPSTNLTLKEAALAKGVSEDLYDRVVIPLNLTRPGTADVPSGPQKS